MTQRVVLTACSLLLLAGSAAWADLIKLKDGTAVPGQVVQKDADNVVVVVPRSAVDSIDGKPLPPPVGVGAPAPDFSVADLSGTTHTLSSYRGQVVVLKFWATWCPHCRSDVGMMQELYTRYQGHGVQFVTVSSDQDRAKLDAFIKEKGITYPVVDAGSSPTAPGIMLPGLYETAGVPHYFVINQQGTITGASAGSFVESKRTLEDMIKPLLSAVASTAS